MMEAVRTSETWVYLKKTTLWYIAKGYNLHTFHHENLKSQNINNFIIPGDGQYHLIYNHIEIFRL
jgi:hypothetical protein